MGFPQPDCPTGGKNKMIFDFIAIYHYEDIVNEPFNEAVVLWPFLFFRELTNRTSLSIFYGLLVVPVRKHKMS